MKRSIGLKLGVIVALTPPLLGIVMTPLAAQTAEVPAATTVNEEDSTVPPRDRAYADADVLTRAGIVNLKEFMGVSLTQRVVTRYEFVVAVARTLQALDESPELTQKFQQSPQAMSAFTHLMTEFGPDFQKLGVDVTARLAALAPKQAADKPQGAVTATFEDIPPHHWAFNAVQRLWEAGILVGYPDHAATGSK